MKIVQLPGSTPCTIELPGDSGYEPCTRMATHEVTYVVLALGEGYRIVTHRMCCACMRFVLGVQCNCR